MTNRSRNDEATWNDEAAEDCDRIRADLLLIVAIRSRLKATGRRSLLSSEQNAEVCDFSSSFRFALGYPDRHREPNIEQNVERSVARDDDSSHEAWSITLRIPTSLGSRWTKATEYK